MTFFSVAHTPTTRRKSDIVSHFSLAMIIISVEQITTTPHAHERKNKQRSIVFSSVAESKKACFF